MLWEDSTCRYELLCTTWCLQKQDQGSMLHTTSNTSPYAKQQSIFDRKRLEEQQHQSEEDHERLDSRKLPVRLTMKAQADPSDAEAESGGNVHVALESWISRATAKARAKLRE